MGLKLKKVNNRYRRQGIYPRPPRLVQRCFEYIYRFKGKLFESCHTWIKNCHIYEWVVCYIVNVWGYTCIWIMCHVCMLQRCFEYMHFKGKRLESCHTYELLYEWVMAYIWMNHVIHMNESVYTYVCVMSCIWVYVSCHAYECVIVQRCFEYTPFKNVMLMNESCIA